MQFLEMKDDLLKFWETGIAGILIPIVLRHSQRSGKPDYLPILSRVCMQVSKQSQQTFLRSWVDGGEVAGDEVVEKSYHK